MVCIRPCISVAGVAYAETEMERAFQSPPVAARPWAYWWWLNSNVTREGITRDLEEMNRQGIQGVMIFNAGGGDSHKVRTFSARNGMRCSNSL